MSAVGEEQKGDKLKPWLPVRWDDEADVVVVGYGGSGACAAIAAHDAGAQALILEKAPFGGGNTGCSGGGMAIPGDVPNAIEHYRALTHGIVDETLVCALAEAMVELPHQLEEWGAELEYFPREPEYPTLPGANSFRQGVHLARTAPQKEEGMDRARGEQLFDFLDNQVKKRGIKIICQTPVKGLIQDFVTKDILGVKAESSTGEIHIKARRGVVLTCGGFQNNKEMLVNFLPYLSELPIYPLGTPYNTGDGILMASEVGAKLWHMAGIELGNFAPKAPSEKFGVGFRLMRQMEVGSQAIYVNKQGKRFMNESIVLSHRKDLFPVQYWDHERAGYPNIPFYLVFDETFRKKRPLVAHGSWWYTHHVYQWSDDNSAEIEQGWIVKADTTKELAVKVGIDSDGLAKTISQYNGYCRRDKDSEFGRAKEWLAPIETPPYYATELCEPIINTQGGPKHNERAQVLDKNDKPIPRLYAAGELGSFFYPLYQSFSNVPEALAFGRIAGENATALAPWG